MHDIISVSAADEVADSEPNNINGAHGSGDTAQCACEGAAQPADENQYDEWELDDGDWAAIAAQTP